jgi:von Willebrand factor type A domain
MNDSRERPDSEMTGAEPARVSIEKDHRAFGQRSSSTIAASSETPATPYLPRREIPAWLMSCLLHGSILLAAWLLFRPSQRGAEVEGERETGIVLVSADPQAEYLTEGSLDSASPSEQQEASTAESLPSTNDVLPDLPGLPSADQIAATGNSDLNRLPSADGLLNGVQANTEIGGHVKTQIFGVQGTGSKFVYVFDRSASMEGFGGRPMAAAKAQLIASIKSLGPTQQFQIIFYNENPTVFNPNPGLPPRLLFGTDENKEAAERFIRQMQGDGSTQHLPALEMALAMSPDVIFFLTDAQEPRLTNEEMQAVDRMNVAVASINCIEFGSKEGYDRDNFLVRLARLSRGQHTYRNVTTLSGD